MNFSPALNYRLKKSADPQLSTKKYAEKLFQNNLKKSLEK